MNRFLILLLFFFVFFRSHARQVCPLIPAPQHAVQGEGAFQLNKRTALVMNSPSLQHVGEYLQQELLRLKALPLAVQKTPAANNSIHLELKHNDKLEEAYTLGIDKKGITVQANSVAGVFNGVSSLLQLISYGKLIEDELSIAAWQIEDQPKYAWRGLMLDESRYFIGKKKLLSIIDWMAFYKLNRLHWHLTDEPAWRMEVKKYPKLTLIGGVGNYNDPSAPAAYYTQQEIAEIVNYASKRNITIIPEIDMPGHATAANRAYPQYSGGGNAQHPDFTFDPSKDATYTFLSNILRETNALFPAAMLHLGGDEVSFGTDKWAQNEGIKRLMEQHKLKTLKGVENYFMERMADSVYQMNAKLLVWDEMVDINLPKDKTVIFWWRHDKPAQLKTSLKKGYQTVLCPRLPYYFDFVQDSTHKAGRKWGKLYNTMEDVYTFSVDSWVKNKDEQKSVLGLQANLWTETVTNSNRLDYLLFPRLAAFAEAAWSDDEVKNYQKFEGILKEHLPLYREQNVYFYNPFNPSEIPEPVYFKKDRKDLNAEEN